jgi:hypothetical protein
MVLGALAFVAIGFWVRRFDPAIGYLAMGFFGLCAVGIGLNLLPNSSYLRLTREGFTVCTMFKCRSIRWVDVGKFGVAHIGARKVVGWDPPQSPSTAEKAAAVMTGYGSILPDTYGLTTEELVNLLNRVRDEHAAQTI